MNKIKNVAKKYGIEPSKKLGQNFLTDKTVAQKFVDLSTKNSQVENFVEIGPGLGTITLPLLKNKKVKELIAIEPDEKLIKAIKNQIQNDVNGKKIKLINKDVRKWDESSIKEKYTILGNLPFHITGDILEKFILQTENQPERLVFGVQKEVGEKITKKAPNMNRLSFMVGLFGEAEIKEEISPDSFWPQPHVWTTIVEIKPKPKENYKEIFKKLAPAFKLQRKTLPNALSQNTNISKKTIKEALVNLDIKKSIRPESLTLDNWINLYKNIKNK